jgi:glycerophosphoryl diester phosphodiesterase
MSFLEGSPPRVIAHRGLALEHAENTLGAFGAALVAGADILETDVYLSKDGQVIIAHDADLARVAGRPHLVSELSARELSRIDLGFGEGFSTLSEVLEEFPTARFNIDLKNPTVVDAFVDTVKKTASTPRVLVASFDENTRARAVLALSPVASSATSAHVMRGRAISALGLPIGFWNIPPEIVALQVPPSHRGLALVTPSLIGLARRKGLEVHVWTINEPRQMARFWQMGVSGIVTDRTDLAVTVRNELT